MAKRVRTDTRIGAHPVSVAYAAVRLARQVFARLDQACVLLIGAGDTIELAARHLADAKVQRLLVANRTLEHAQALADAPRRRRAAAGRTATATWPKPTS